MKRTEAPRGYFPGEPYTSKPRTRYKATGEYREPKRGEYFLSGAMIEAYRAPNDLPSAYWIAVPVEMTPCPYCAGTGNMEK